MAVDAPTLYDRGLNTHENRMPPNEEVEYRAASFQVPSPFSRPDPITTVDMRLRVK